MQSYAYDDASQRRGMNGYAIAALERAVRHKAVTPHEPEEPKAEEVQSEPLFGLVVVVVVNAIAWGAIAALAFWLWDLPADRLELLIVKTMALLALVLGSGVILLALAEMDGEDARRSARRRDLK